MEDVLGVYQRPHDPSAPVVCMDEQPVQRVKETRTPVPMAPGRPERVDYESERAGTASIFMFTEPHSGWRQVRANERRTKIDWALQVRDILDGRYADVPRVVLVQDNLNTHSRLALRSTRRSRQPRRGALRSGWRSTTRQSTAAG